MADVHSKEIRSKNNLSRFSGWQPLKARIQSLKCLCEDLYMPMDFDTSCTIKASPASPISFYQNTKLQSLYMAVFGMGMKAATYAGTKQELNKNKLKFYFSIGSLNF